MRFGALGLALVLLSYGGLPGLAQEKPAAASPPASTQEQTASQTTPELVKPSEEKPKRIGGSVTPPIVIRQATPEFSKEARQQKIGGSVLVYVQVDTHGLPQHVRVIRGIGFGLDEKAVEAVRQYRFKPSTQNGKPVLIEMNILVNFEISTKPS